jgi:RHS repeat-associated protein
LIGKRHFNGSSVMVGFTSAYDKSSNKFFERALHAESRSSLYDSYDSINRLLDYQRGVLTSGGGSITTPISLPNTDQERAYKLDALGNWSTTTYTPEGGTSTVESRTHNKLNEVLTYGVAPASTSVLYDHGNNTGTSYPSRGNGNIIDDGVRTYAYDAFNRVTTISRKSDSATVGQYTYDARGRRIQKIVSNGGITGTVSNGTTRYLYDSDQCIEELDDTGSTTRQFVWGQYIDELVQMKTDVDTGSQPLSPGDYYLLSDLLYRSAALTDSSGDIVEAYDTDAYGNTLVFSGPGTDSDWFTDDDVLSNQPACEYIFTGRHYDPESQIYFYRARYYHPQLGRFISRDPIGYSDSLNLYEYVKGHAAIALDPTGQALRINITGSLLGGSAFYQIMGSIPTLEGECETISARLGGNIGLLSLIGNLIGFGVAGAILQQGLRQLGGQADLQVYGVGEFTLCYHCGKVCAKQCEVGVGARLNIGGTWGSIKGNFIAGAEGRWDLCKGTARVMWTAAISVQLHISWWINIGIAETYGGDLINGSGWPAPLSSYLCSSN